MSRLRTLLQALINVQYPYPTLLERYRAQALLWVLDVLFIINFINLVIIAQNADTIDAELVTFTALGLPLVALLIPLVGVMVQRGWLMAASRLLMSMLTILIVSAYIAVPDLLVPQAAGLIIIAVTALLLSGRETILAALIMLTSDFMLFLRFDIANAAATATSQTIILQTFIVIGLYVLMALVCVTMARWLREIGRRLQNEISRLRLVTFPLLRMNLTSDESLVINQALESIATHLGLPTVRVLLLDKGDTTSARVLYSGLTVNQQGRQTLEPGSALASVIQTREAIFINDDSTAAERAHLLPGTTSGYLVPLLHRDEVLGLLDVQSVGERPIEASEQELLDLIGLNLAVTIGSSRDLQEVQNELAQQQQIVQRQRTRLRQIEKTEQQAIFSAWTDYLDQRDQKVIGFDVSEMSMQLIPTDHLPETMRRALDKGDVDVRDEGEQQHVTLPIQLRGQTLGAASFSVPRNRPVTRRQLDIMRNVIQRLALALDNKRLFEQSQSQAQRESKANEIASLLLTSTDIDAVLQMAASSFNDALGAIQTRIQLIPDTSSGVQERPL